LNAGGTQGGIRVAGVEGCKVAALEHGTLKLLAIVLGGRL